MVLFLFFRSQYVRDEGGETAPRSFKIVAVDSWNPSLPGWKTQEYVVETFEETINVNCEEDLPELHDMPAPPSDPTTSNEV